MVIVIDHHDMSVLKESQILTSKEDDRRRKKWKEEKSRSKPNLS